MHIDLNSDVGESFGTWKLGDDGTIFALVSSANIACGFHAGDPTTLMNTCSDAAAHGVRIGAQVGYADLRGFGRRFIDVPPDDLLADVIYQIGALDALARSMGSAVAYVKPHGALYNTIVDNRPQASAVVRAVTSLNASLPVVGLPGSLFLQLAEDSGLRCVSEAFADRAYLPDGRLVPRTLSGAVISDPVEVAQRVVRMVTEGEVVAIDGSIVRVLPESICLHGDTPGAVAIATAVRDCLDSQGISVAPFIA